MSMTLRGFARDGLETPEDDSYRGTAPLRSVRQPSTTKLLLTVQEAADVLSMSRASLYRLIRAGDVPILKIGAMTRVAPNALNTYVNGLDNCSVQRPLGGVVHHPRIRPHAIHRTRLR